MGQLAAPALSDPETLGGSDTVLSENVRWGSGTAGSDTVKSKRGESCHC